MTNVRDVVFPSIVQYPFSEPLGSRGNDDEVRLLQADGSLCGVGCGFLYARFRDPIHAIVIRCNLPCVFVFKVKKASVDRGIHVGSLSFADSTR